MTLREWHYAVAILAVGMLSAVDGWTALYVGVIACAIIDRLERAYG